MGEGGQSHAPAALQMAKRPVTHRTGGWVGPWTGLYGCGISHPQPGFDPWTVHPVENCYTE